MTEQEEASLKFREWKIMEQQVNELKQYLRSQRGARPHSRHTVYAVGSPRAFKVVTYSTNKMVGFFKVVAWDVRKGSSDFLAKEWEKTPYTRG